MKYSQQIAFRNAHITQICQALGLTRKDYKRFLIVGNKLHRYFELYCNGYTGAEPIYQGNRLINEYTEQMYTKDTKPLFAQAREMAKEKGLTIFFQTDPRGGTIYLDKQPIPYNNYTQAYCIY